MWDLILASLIPTIAICAGLWWINRRIPIVIQTVLNDVGSQLNEMFANPTIKKAYSVLGKQGVESKADAALREKVANIAVNESPLLAKALDYLGITPIEGLKVLQDPLLQPIIARVLQGLQGSQSQSSEGRLP